MKRYTNVRSSSRTDPKKDSWQSVKESTVSLRAENIFHAEEKSTSRFSDLRKNNSASNETKPDDSLDEACNQQSPSKGHSYNSNHKQMKRLGRGLISPEAALDLHGYNQDEARVELERFVGRSFSSGLRCVLVITGRGLRSSTGGVLKQAVPLWLSQLPHTNMLLGTATAQPKDGGAGALYLLLRRKRSGTPGF